MGEIIKILDKINCGKSLYQISVRIESAECIHFHWRNMRIVMSDNQFMTMSKCIVESQSNWNGEKGEGNGLVLSDMIIPDAVEDTIVIELNNPNVHVHLKDLRLELEPDEFLKIADSMTRAAKQLRDL